MDKSSSKKKNFFIVKKEPNQEGGYVYFRYMWPGVAQTIRHTDPSAVGLYASPLMNRPDFAVPERTTEIARSIGQITMSPNTTIKGRVMGSPFPGTVTVPNMPLTAGIAPVVPLRKGDFIPGLFDVPLKPVNYDEWIKAGPIYPYSTLGYTSNQPATMIFTVDSKKYKIILTCGKIQSVLNVLNSACVRCDATTTIRIDISVPMGGFYWSSFIPRVRYANKDTFINMVNEILRIDGTKIYNADTNVELTKNQMRDEMIAFITEIRSKVDSTNTEKIKRYDDMINKLSSEKDTATAPSAAPTVGSTRALTKEEIDEKIELERQRNEIEKRLNELR